MFTHAGKSAQNKSNAVARGNSKEGVSRKPPLLITDTRSKPPVQSVPAVGEGSSATAVQFVQPFQFNGRRPNLAERQQRLRQVMYTRQIMRGVPGLERRNASRYANLFPARTIPQIIALATGCPAHRTAAEMVNLAAALPACLVPDLLTLAGAPALLAVNDLALIYNTGTPTRNAQDVADLIGRAPGLQANDLAALISIQLPRSVQQIATLGRQKPPHRSFQEAVDLADSLPDIGIPNLVLMLQLPVTRSVRHLRKLVVNKPPFRSIAYMEGIARLLRDVGTDNLIALATLPPAREQILQQLVSNKPATVSVADMVQLAAGIPPRGLNELIVLAGLRTTMSVADIIQLGGAPAYRTANDLIVLAHGLAGRPVADMVIIASIVPAAGMSANMILEFITDTLAFGLSAAQIQEAARLPALLNVANTHAHIANILTAAHLLPSLDDVCTVIQAAPLLPKAALIQCMRRAPGNLANLVLHVADLNTAAGHLNAPPQITRILNSDALVAHGDDVNTVIAGGGNMRIAPLIDCMLRSPGNLANLVLHVADLNNAAGILATLLLKTAMLASDILVANGNTTFAVLGNVHNIGFAPIIGAMSVSLARLNSLNTYMVDIDRALTGQPNITQQKLLNVLDHIQNIGVAAPLGGGHDAGLRRAQAFGAETQNVLNSLLGQPGNVVFLNNLQRAVDRLGGVVWGNRGGNFNRTGWNGNFGGNIYVPVTVNGFNLTNHVIAHLINPQNAGHRVTISDIVAATNNYAGNVYDAYNNGYRDHYIGNGMTMIAPTGVQSIITIFFH